ncbi:MAG TPA: RidA family protein [Candidatus Lumbricidophila sp.]|nr:RidA family protein [Candidatus Lumbricidophila sp.]
MPNVTLIRSDGLAKTPGYAYASSIATGARVVHLAGACPLDADGSVTPVGDYAGQAAKCLENMMEALADAGGTLSDIAYTRVLVASPRNDDLGTVWAVVRDAFADHEAPSTLFGVTVLGYEHQLVEIEAVASITG